MNYLATRQGLRHENLNTATDGEVVIVCARTGHALKFNVPLRHHREITKGDILLFRISTMSPFPFPLFPFRVLLKGFRLHYPNSPSTESGEDHMLNIESGSHPNRSGRFTSWSGLCNWPFRRHLGVLPRAFP